MVDKDKRAARERAAATGESYATALRTVRKQQRPVPPEGERIVWPYVLGTWRDGDLRYLEAREADTWKRVGITSVPWRDPDELVAEWLPIERSSPPSRDKALMVKLGRPDLLAWQLGMDGQMFGWDQWSDGILRCDVKPLDRRHVAEAGPLAPGQRTIGAITVREYPQGAVVADLLLDEPLPLREPDDNTARFEIALSGCLDAMGFTCRRWGWQELPGGRFLAAVRPGHLAQRPWYREARLRVLREYRAGAPELREARVFTPGEEVVMKQWADTGQEIDTSAWWTSGDIDLALILPDDAVEIVEILHEDPPTWAESAIGEQRIAELLAPYHPGAAAASAAWIAAGLHVSDRHWALEIRTPGPEYRLLGKVSRDYWNKMRHSKRYEGVYVDSRGYEHEQPFDRLPLDPAATAAETETLTRARFAAYR
jgi:hypothetical protein